MGPCVMGSDSMTKMGAKPVRETRQVQCPSNDLLYGVMWGDVAVRQLDLALDTPAVFTVQGTALYQQNGSASINK